MRKLLLLTCILTGLSFISYSQCEITTASEAALRAAVNNLNNGTCTSVTVSPSLAGSTISITNNPIDLTSNSGTVKTLNLQGLTLTSTANIEGVIRVNGGQNFTLTNVTINRAQRNGIYAQSGNNIIIQNSAVYEAAQAVGPGFAAGDTIANWTGIVTYGYTPGRGDLYSGIFFEGTINNFTIQNSTISGNNGNGIRIHNNGGTGTRLITNNKVGVTANGTEPYGNFGEGILIESSQRVTVTNNHVSANGNHDAWKNDPSIAALDPKTAQAAGVQSSYLLGSGIELRSGGNHIVQGNIVGTDALGASLLSTSGAHFGNHKIGIYIKGSQNNQIGGALAGQGNVVGGNGYAFENNHTSDSNPGAGLYYYGVMHGIQLHGTTGNANNNTVYGNFVGWYNGNCIPNKQDAMSLLGYDPANVVTGNIIGGPGAGQANVFAGGAYGVFIQSSQVRNNTISGNYIGTSGSSGVDINCAPSVAGVKIQSGSYNNTVGSATAPNYIANIDGNAVEVDGTTSVDNRIIGNEMRCNTGGIVFLATGNENYGSGTVTINVPTSDANHLEGFTVATTDRIDIYIADTCKIASSALCQNNGGTTSVGVQGLKWITSVTAKTDTKFIPPGSAFWELNITQAMRDAGLTLQNAVITATESNGTLNTSQFSTCSYRTTCTPPATATINTSANGFCPGQNVTLTANQLAGHQYTWYRNGVKIAGGSGSTTNTLVATQGGNYTVKIANIIDTLNCATTSAARTITAYTNPTAPAIQGNDVVCTGTTVNYTTANTFATYTWAITPNTNPVLSITGQGTNQISVNYGTATGTRTIQLNVTNSDGCSSATPATRAITIRPLPTSNAQPTGANRFCQGSTVSLTGNTPATGETVAWTKTGGSAGGTITSPTSAVTTVTGLPAGVHTFTYTVSNGVCTSATSTVQITIDGTPTVSAAGSDADICAASYQLQANTPATGMQGTWTWTSSRTGSTAAVAPLNSPTATVTNIADGETLTLTWSIASGVCTASTDVVVVRRAGQLTSPNASVAASAVCVGSTVQLSGNPAGAGETGVWSGASGTITQNNGQATVTGLTSGNYTFTYTMSNGVCPPAVENVSVRVDQNPTVSNAGTNASICTPTYQLNANLPTVGTGIWTSNNASATVSPTNSPTASVSGIPAGQTVRFIWTVTNGVCNVSTSFVDITRTPVLTTANAGANQVICENGVVTLTGNAVATGETSLWSGTSGTITNPSNASTTVTGLGVGTHAFTYTISNGVCDNNTATTSVQIDRLPTVSEAGAADTICVDTYRLNANVPSVGTGLWTSNNTAVTITPANSATATASGIPAGQTVRFTWSVSNGVCSASTSTVDITRTTVLTIADAGLNDTICVGSSASLLGVSPKTGETVSWTGPGVIASPASPSTSVSGLTVGTHTFTYRVDNGVCTLSSDEVVVIVQGTATANITDPATAIKPINTSGTSLTAQAVQANYTGRWYIAEGTNGSFISTNLNATTVNIGNVNALNDTLTVCWELSDNFNVCPNTEECVGVVRLDISAPSFNQSTICESAIPTFGDVVGTPHDVNKGEITSWVGLDGATFTQVNANAITPNLTGSGTYRYEYTISNPTLLGNPSASAIKVIQVDAVPTQAVIVASDGDTSVCSPTFVLTGNTPIIGTGAWTRGTTAIGTEPSTTVNLAPGTTAQYTWTIGNGVCPSTSDTIDVTRVPDLTLPGVSADMQICAGNNVTISANAIKGGETGVWSGTGGQIVSPNSPITDVRNLAVGVNYFTYRISNGVCTDATDSVMVDVKALPVVTNVSGDQLICFDNGRTAKYVATGNSNVGQFVWTLPADAELVRHGGVRNDTLVVTYRANNANQTVWVKAISEFNCSSVDSLSLPVTRLSLELPEIDPGSKSCAGVENVISVTNIDSELTYVWTANNGAQIIEDNGGGSVRILTPEVDFQVSVTASRTDIACDISTSTLVDVYELIQGIDLTGLFADPIIDANGKCNAADERFPSTAIIRAEIAPVGLPDLSYTWVRQYRDLLTLLPDTDDTHFIDYSLLLNGEYMYKVTVKNENCEGNELSDSSSIEILPSLPVKFELSDNVSACRGDEVILGVRNNGLHDDVVKYTWYHNNYTMVTDQVTFFDNLINRLDTNLVVLQVDTTPNPNQTVLSQTVLYEGYDAYVDLVGTSEIAYDNYKIIGVRDQLVAVKAEPQYCIVYDKDDATRGENLLWDTINTSDYVYERPGAVAVAFDLKTLDSKVVNEELVLAEGYVLEYDELILGKIEDKFALYDNTGSEPANLIRQWYVVGENNTTTTQNILSNKEIIAYPRPDHRPETVTYMLWRSNEVCADSDYVNVTINYLPWPPNAFSPNGDDVFDTWEITNVDKYPGTVVKIFNRWGTEIVEIKDYHLKENWWDGTKDGSALPTGAYFYRVDFNNGLEPITGAVSLIK